MEGGYNHIDYLNDHKLDYSMIACNMINIMFSLTPDSGEKENSMYRILFLNFTYFMHVVYK